MDNNTYYFNEFNPSTNFKEIIILLVEDNPINQNLIKHIFKNWGLQFDMASNGIEALKLLEVKKYNLILMDIQMPEMDGYSATSHIRRELKLNIPIIAMTAHAISGELDKCRQCGMNDYISKPFREEQLHEIITKYTTPSLSQYQTTNSDEEKPSFKFINLHYLHEVSSGDTEFERTIAKQFIETIPHDLQLLEKYWHEQQLQKLKDVAHNMKTTISVMGLNNLLEPYLDNLENETLNEMSFLENYSEINQICNYAILEATAFIHTI